MAISRRIRTAVARASKLLASGSCSTLRQAAAEVGVAESTLRRHGLCSRARTRAPSLRTAAGATATLQARSKPPEGAKADWWPPGYTPGFTDYYRGIVEEDATADELAALADSHDYFVQAAVAVHPNTDASTLSYLAAQNPLSAVQAALLTNPELPSEALSEIHSYTGSAPRTPNDQETRMICEAHPNWAGPDTHI